MTKHEVVKVSVFDFVLISFLAKKSINISFFFINRFIIGKHNAHLIFHERRKMITLY